MRAEFAGDLRCPHCKRERTLDLYVDVQDSHEVREGTLRCSNCSGVCPVREGIAEMMVNPPEFVKREAAGLDRFADLMRADGWDREVILKLPEHGSGYWYSQAVLMQQVLATVDLAEGETILDVGSNTCWASAKFAERGLRPVALDINANELQGLATGDWWLEDKGLYMDRVLGMMFDMPLSSESMDWAWCCEVLHHNHYRNLRKTMRELHRVLKPGGTLIVANETLRSLGKLRIRPGKDVAEFEGHEHAFMRATYVRAARSAGFDVEIRGPWFHTLFTSDPICLDPSMRTREGFQKARDHAIRRDPRARRAFLAWKAYVQGDTSLHMLATKPAVK